MEDTAGSSTVTSSLEVVVADTVFLLMTKEHRISKHLRAKWYLKHVNTIMDFPYSDNAKGHPQLLSVLVNGGEALRPAEDGTPVKFKLATDTTVNFLSTHHDIVFAVDVSFSTISSSTADGEVQFDKMFESLRKCVTGLTKTFIIPGSDNYEFVPCFYATVIAYYPLEDCPVQQVLTHGYLLSHRNVKEFIKDISWELTKFENGVANYLNSLIAELPGRRSRLNSGEAEVDDSQQTSTDSIKQLADKHLSPEKGFFNLIKNAMLAIHLLPTNCSSGIIVITDGNVGIGDVGRYDNLLVQLLSQSCTCSIIEVQCESPERRGIGRIPHSEMLQFIATATFGAYFNDTPCMEKDDSLEMNVYHSGVLCWDFKKSIKDLARIGPVVTSMAYERTMRKKGMDYHLQVPINCVITTRLKEGFTIKTVDASKDAMRRRFSHREHYIEVIMVLPWRKNICIEYKAGSVWPVPATNPVTAVDICYEGNYHFLHDLTCKQSRTHLHTATKYRQILVDRFWKSIESLKLTDESLVNMQSFHTKIDFSRIPDSIKKGKALFYCKDYSDRAPEIISHSSESDVEQFSSYWRRILCTDFGMPLDKSGISFDRSSHIMEKWFHITRVYLVLEHDPKHPEMLNIPNTHDKYHSLQCRQAAQALTNNLREWSDFELLESSHYVKYIHRQDNDTTPISGYHAENWCSFCMIILNIKGACVTLRLTFLGGTDSIYRTRLINELKEVLQSLHFQKRPEKQTKSGVSYSAVKVDRAARGSGPSGHVPPLERNWEDRQCCILMSKPLDRVLIRYEQVPKSLRTVDRITQDISPMQGVPSRLANYLYHRRWIWYLHPSNENVNFEPLDFKSIGYILNIISKLRLQEGFHFSHTNSGIVSMILEVDMTNIPDEDSPIPKEDEESLSCLVQYVTFPPQRKLKVHDSLPASSVSDNDVDDDAADITSSELYMVTEVWIEPQHGYVANNPPERCHYNRCRFYEWPEQLFPMDKRCVTVLVTLDHLLKFCTPVNRTSMSSSLVSGRLDRQSVSDEGEVPHDVTRVEEIPFVFSIMELLPVCQQTEIILPTYHVSRDLSSSVKTPRSTSTTSTNAGEITNNILFKHLLYELEKHPGAHEMELTPDEYEKFMKQVEHRPRDESPSVPPVPFEWNSAENSPSSTAQQAGTPLSAPNTARSSSEPRGAASAWHGHTPTGRSHTPTGRSDTPTGQSHTPTGRSHTPTGRSVTTSTAEEESVEIPEWKCYCFPDLSSTDKSGAPNTVTILFLPASYQSLSMISRYPETHRAADCSNVESANEVPPLNLNGYAGNTPTDSAHSYLPLPIYLYHCARSQVVKRLVNYSTYQPAPDEYIDMNPPTIQESDAQKEAASSQRSQKAEQADDVLHSPTYRRRRRNESSGSRYSFSRAQSMEFSNTQLIDYCGEIFYKSFVHGVFHSLQTGHHVCNEDIELALSKCVQNHICEVDITDFLQHVCSHLKVVLDRSPSSHRLSLDSSANDQVFLQPPATVTTPGSATKCVKFDTNTPLSSANSSPEYPKKQNRTSGSSDCRASSLRSSWPIRLPCHILSDRKCASQKSAQRVKEKFADVLDKWFKPIATCKDVFYYSPPYSTSSSPQTDDQKTSAFESDEMFEDEVSAGHMTNGESHMTDGGGHLMHSMSVESRATTIDDSMPLFVYLTASIHNERVDQPVSTIPVCLCELEEALEGKESIDVTPGTAKVTLDIICLTLPNELSDVDDTDEQYSDRSRRQTRFSTGSVDERVCELERDFGEALAQCQQGIEWLVRDEIAAAMRSSGSITADTLKMVTDHVKSSTSEKSCKYAKERLRYVFGAEDSHAMFLQEFVRMNVTGYQLVPCSDYYYLSVDRARLKSSHPRDLHSFQSLQDLECVVGLLSDMNQQGTQLDSQVAETGPDVTPSSKMPLARVSSLPEPTPVPSWSLDFSTSAVEDNRKSAEFEEEFSSGSEEGLENRGDTELTSPIPISGRSADDHQYGDQQYGDETSASRETILNSLPRANPIEHWNRDEDEFSSKCGSLPKAFSSSNVNIDCSTGRKILKRVSSGPQDLRSAAHLAKAKIRHVSEDTGRSKRATFAAGVRSPPSASHTLMSCMKESSDAGSSSRSRNPSGPLTPVSMRNNGSMGSALRPSSADSDQGYEADFSDEEGTADGLSLLELGARNHQMPDFWLIMKIVSNGSDDGDRAANHRLAQADGNHGYRVDVFFHTSGSETAPSGRHFSDSLEGNIPKAQVYSQMLSEIRRTCKLVNQRLLLRDLYNKRRCDVLLEEDWDDELNSSGSTRGRGLVDDMDTDAAAEDTYLFARTEFEHGHFKCNVQWEKVFTLHPRLRSSKNKLSSNRGFLGLKAVLSNLAITNRSNMFVHKENQTENIFYLRLSECGDTTSRMDSADDTRSVAGETAAPSMLSRSSSVRSMPRFREDSDSSRRQSVDESDEMQFLSLSKASMAKRHPSCDDGVKLSVYGIDPVGSDIKVELVKMLEARLDTTILGEIEMLLARNPNCMLTPQDVQFLQKKEPPSVSLKLSLPDEVLHHQMAVLSYLRQNLLIPDFLFHPKYQDSEHRFMDYTESVLGAIPMTESNTFLFNKSPSYQNAGKGAGLAVIYLQLVDSMNHPKNILDCPKADMDGWKKLNVSSFTRLTQVTKVSPDDSSTCMTTAAFIRFSIWLRGDIDVPSLESKLSRCVQHSLSDFVCEFYALTAPLCAVPPELLCETQTTGQIFSLPAKGNLTPKNAGSKHPPLTKAKSTTGSAFSFSSDHVSMREQLSSPTLSIAESLGDGTRTPLQVDVEKYLFGEKGHLLPFYTETLIAWFEFCTQLGVPAVTKSPCGLLNGCVVESIMKEIESVVSELPGVSVQPFKLTHGQYLPYSTSRNAETEPGEPEEPTHLDTPFSQLSAGHIMTVRNRQLWIDSVMGKQDDDGGPMLTPQPNSLPRVSKNNQKFPPVYVGVETSPSLTSSLPHFSLDRQLLPRQQFLLLVIRNAELTLYSYNLADGKDMSFQEHITQSVKKVTRWNNARFHLLNSVAHQKMGLFQHASIQDVPRERHCTDKNLSTSTCEDTCLLVKSSRPVQEKPRHKSAVTAASSRFRQTTPTPGPISGLDKVFRGLKPTRPMHLSKTGKERDPIIRHGSQLLETHKNEMRDEERRNTLDSLYTNWLDRPSTEITEDQLNVLKQSSRLVHHVVTPLLFSPTWRNKAINLPKTVEELSRIEESKLAVIKQRSRNNSGTSVRSAKGGEGRSGTRDSPTSAVIKGYEEEAWHEEMRNAFVSSYIDYLRQTQQPEQADRSELTSLDELRFSTIKLLSRRPNKTVPEFHRKHSSGGSGTEQLVRRRATESLQMSMPGGIFLIELSFQEVYFVVKLYVFSSPLLSIYTQTYHSLHKKTYMSNLVDMCDRLKDNTHCHSFSYDFHLRAAHKYIKSSKVFNDSYHLVNMLHDFTLYYSDSPRFSRNAIAKDVLMLESTNNPCKRLYDHILKHENRVLLMMKKIAMKDEDDLENQEDSCEYALVYHKHIQNHPVSGKKLPEYEASIIIAHNHYPAQRHHAVKGSLHLAYFVILVNKEQLFPIKMTPVVSDSQPQVSDSQHVLEISADKLSADSSLSVSPISPSPIQERKTSQQSPDTPFSPPTSLSVHQILANQCSDVKKTLTDLVETASLQCRKNTLWTQMVQIPRESDRRSVSDPSKSRTNTELSSFDEFEELLNYAVNEEIQLSESILSVIYSQSNIWFTNLTKVLHAKYGSQYREYVRSDKQLTYAVVLVAGVEGAAILLRVDSQRRGAKLTLMLQDGKADHVLDDKVFNMALSDYVNTLLFHMWAQMAV